MAQNQQSFKPQNQLEQFLIKARAGQMPVKELVRQLITSELFVPSVNEVREDGSGFLPLLFDRDGVSLAAAFTAIVHVNSYRDRAKYLVRMRGGEFLKRVPPGYGVTINPGYEATFEISPPGIKEVTYGDATMIRSRPQHSGPSRAINSDYADYADSAT